MDSQKHSQTRSQQKYSAKAFATVFAKTFIKRFTKVFAKPFTLRVLYYLCLAHSQAFTNNSRQRGKTAGRHQRRAAGAVVYLGGDLGQ